jgi:hypothetical protein
MSAFFCANREENQAVIESELPFSLIFSHLSIVNKIEQNAVFAGPMLVLCEYSHA